MEKLFDLDASQEFDDAQSSSASSDDKFLKSDIVAGNFEGVSGVGVASVSEEDDQANISSIQDMLSKLNTRSDDELAKAIEDEEAARLKYLEEEEERLRLAKEKYNRERFEREQEALRRKREEEEREANECEDESKKASLSSVFSTTKGFFEKKLRSVIPSKGDEQVEELDSAKEGGDFNEEVPLPSSYEEEYAPEPEEVMAKSSKGEREGVGKEESQPNDSVLEIEEDKSAAKKSLRSLFSAKGSGKPRKQRQKDSKEKQDVPVSTYEEPDWKYIATHDEMTGLLNIRAYTEDLSRMGSKLGVIFFDINNLKYVNDTLTHEAGNRLIKGVVNVIGEYFGKENLYRIGGDEFVVLIEKPGKGEEDRVAELCLRVHNKLAEVSKNDADKIVYAVSVGYAFGDGKSTKEEVVKAADIAMYQNKKAYKLSHKELDARGQGAIVQAPEHDELLSKEQRLLKGKIQDGHEKASKGSTQQIVREVQKRASEIEAIFIASPSFDHLFVITDIDDFLDIMDRSKQLIDYSYLYIVYSGGPQYYGTDEYYKEVTHLFESISDALMSGKFRSEKEIQGIPGINIFKNIYV